MCSNTLAHNKRIDKTPHWSWRTNFRIVHLNLVNFCNLQCPNCQSFCTMAPSTDAIPVKYIRKFVDDAIRLKCRFEIIKLYGGEPILHPQISEICDIINDYRKFYLKSSKNSPFNEPVFDCVCDTNGIPQSMDLISKHLPKWMSIQNSEKLTRQSWRIFTNVNVAPIDVPRYKNENELFRSGCCMTTVCGGVSLLCNGSYYPCPVSGHIDRVFGLKTGIPDLENFINLGIKYYRDVFQKSCRYCGIFKYPREMSSKQDNSPTWKKAFSDYNISRIKLG